ncbi:hypothetical protein ACP4OV_010496 [Aristida adscensionis]
MILALNEVDKLSRETQHSLRRTMLKYSSSCRLILCCNSSSKVTEAVRSRCLNVTVNAPTEDQIIQVLEFIGKKENLHLPAGFAARYPFAPNQVAHWEQYVSEIATDILTEQSPKSKLLIELLRKLDVDLKHEICHWAAHYYLNGNHPPGFDPSTCRSMYVRNVNPNVTESLLIEVFQSTGLERCKLIRKEKSSFGFVDYYDRRSAAQEIFMAVT